MVIKHFYTAFNFNFYVFVLVVIVQKYVPNKVNNILLTQLRLIHYFYVISEINVFYLFFKTI